MLVLLLALALQSATVTAGPRAWSFALPGDRLSFAQVFCALPDGRYQAALPYDELFALSAAQLPAGCTVHHDPQITWMECIPPACVVMDPATCAPPPCP